MTFTDVEPGERATRANLAVPTSPCQLRRGNPVVPTLPGAGGQIVYQVIGHQSAQMPRRVGPFAYGVRTIGVDHHRELFVESNQLVDEFLRRLIVTIVVTSTMDEKEITLELMSEVDR